MMLWPSRMEVIDQLESRLAVGCRQRTSSSNLDLNP